MKSYTVDVDFYSIVMTIKAKNKTEAKRKVKQKIKNGVGMLKHINDIFIDEI